MVLSVKNKEKPFLNKSIEQDRFFTEGPSLEVDVEGFSGPIDLLLHLARHHTIDLKDISIAHLTEQYVAFVYDQRARLELDQIADYLVMAAWLTYLKAKILLPKPEEEHKTLEEMSEILSFQLQRLEAMQAQGNKLKENSLLGAARHKRGVGEKISLSYQTKYTSELYDLIRAYGKLQKPSHNTTLKITPARLYSFEEAQKHLISFLGTIPSWDSLKRYVPPLLKEEDPKEIGGLRLRSAYASLVLASLELCRQGHLELKQETLSHSVSIRSTSVSPALKKDPK